MKSQNNLLKKWIKMDLKYVIVSVNDNPLYTSFWDIIRPVLINRIHVKPILVQITDTDQIIDNSDHIIHKIKAIPNIDTGFQAQISRLFVPKFYIDEVCMTSDIDMLLINKHYFFNNTKNIADDRFVILGANAYPSKRYPICYNIAKGSTFAEILEIEDMTFEDFCFQLQKRNQGWDTDELFLGEKVDKFDQKRIHKFNRDWEFGCAVARIDRVNWNYDARRINNYIDSHLLRPYEQYKKQIDELISLL